MTNIKQRGYIIDILIEYTEFLQKRGYIDSDATQEEPYAIDEFLKETKVFENIIKDFKAK